MVASKWESGNKNASRKMSVYGDEDHSLQGKHGKTHAVC